MAAPPVRGVSPDSADHGAVDMDGDGATLQRLRTLLLLLVAFGALGLVTELVLLEHWHAWPQRAPLALLVAGAGGAVSVLLKPTPGLLAAFRLLMALSVASGLIGAFFHFRSNALLEIEIDPGLSLVPLVQAALGGGTPTLAPGAMIQWGVLGLLAVFRHPAGRA